MSDPIADILRKQYGDDFHDVYHHAVAKQIRQQIGRELLEYEWKGTDNYYSVFSDTIREVCQLEAQGE